MNSPAALQSDSTAPKVAYVFPGQGTQQVGMGQDLAQQSPAARALFQEVESALGEPFTTLMFQGPEEELKKTVNAQPAILAVSLACRRAMAEALGEKALPQPAFVAGHSLGEYTALVEAQVLDTADAVRLVRERGRLMQVASELQPGGMAAVLGLDELTLEEICQETGTQISTINADDQIVIAGEHMALARALDLAHVRGAKRVLTLQVAGAFHSRLMEPAREGMVQAISRLNFRDPVVPIVANCNSRPLTTADAVKGELVNGLCTCVQWRRSVTYMANSGVNHFYEIGPGRVLSSLIARVNREVQVTNVSSWNSIMELAGKG